MIYRELGKTGIMVSEIGIGCEGFIGKDEGFSNELFERAFEAGVNCMDLYSPNPEMQRQIGNILRGRRDKFILQSHICTIWQDGQYKATRKLDEVKASFELSLLNLQTDYIDIGMIHYVDSVALWEEVVSGGVYEYAKELKAAGKIRTIGLSSHNPLVALAAVESGLIDVLMFSINPCYDLLPPDDNVENLFAQDTYAKEFLNIDPVHTQLYETCSRMGVGITVMKVFGGGQLLTDNSPAGKALTVNQCIHYALTRPAVASVMSGVHTIEQLTASLNYETSTAEEKDYAAAFADFPKMNWSGHCMYCGHCAPCPLGIEVASVTKFLNLAKAQGSVPETVREHYAALPHKAGECIACGACETRCPFAVKIIENMAAAKVMFGE